METSGVARRLLLSIHRAEFGVTDVLWTQLCGRYYQAIFDNRIVNTSAALKASGGVGDLAILTSPVAA